MHLLDLRRQKVHPGVLLRPVGKLNNASLLGPFEPLPEGHLKESVISSKERVLFEIQVELPLQPKVAVHLFELPKWLKPHVLAHVRPVAVTADDLKRLRKPHHHSTRETILLLIAEVDIEGVSRAGDHQWAYDTIPYQ